MAKLLLIAILDYDADLMYSTDLEAKAWFLELLKWPDELTVWSSEIGDEVGTLQILTLEEVT